MATAYQQHECAQRLLPLCGDDESEHYNGNWTMQSPSIMSVPNSKCCYVPRNSVSSGQLQGIHVRLAAAAESGLRSWVAMHTTDTLHYLQGVLE
jgi:hypothetical protein